MEMWSDTCILGFASELLKQPQGTPSKQAHLHTSSGKTKGNSCTYCLTAVLWNQKGQAQSASGSCAESALNCPVVLCHSSQPSQNLLELVYIMPYISEEESVVINSPNRSVFAYRCLRSYVQMLMFTSNQGTGLACCWGKR